MRTRFCPRALGREILGEIVVGGWAGRATLGFRWTGIGSAANVVRVDLGEVFLE